jgi:predicted aspartyl protease
MAAAGLSAAALLAAGCNTVPPGARAGAAPTVGAALCSMGFSAIPMRALASGHHLVDVTLDGKPATFVVDTGAGATVLHAPYAASFLGQAAATQRGQAIGAGGSIALSAYPITGLSIGGTATGLRQIYALDLGSVVKALDPIAGRPVNGVIGQDVMRAQHAIVDVRQSVLYLMPVDGTKARC